MIGKEVGPYRFLEEIGQGGMGIVYKAVHTQLEQEVAIKVLRPEYAQDPSMRRRFIAEAKLQAKLSHPQVVNIFNYLEDEGHIFLVMEHVKGPTLEQRLATMGRIPPQEAVAICRDVLAALSFMHSRGIIHRDIKPANIMFTETGMVKVTDFGIAKVIGEKGQTRTSMHIGTLCYMSPEQIQGKPVSMASDLYALGITLYQMVTGELPYTGNSEYTIMRAHIEEVPEPPWAIDPRISGELGQVILTALEKQPEHRYTDAHDFLEALAGLAPQPSTAEPAVRSASRPRSRGRSALQRKSLACLTPVAALSAMLAIWLYPGFYNGSGPVIPSVPVSAEPRPLNWEPTFITEIGPVPSTPTPPLPLHQEPDEEPVAVDAPSVIELPEEGPRITQEPVADEPSQETNKAKRATRRAPSRSYLNKEGEFSHATSPQLPSPSRTQRDSGGWYIKK